LDLIYEELNADDLVLDYSQTGDGFEFTYLAEVFKTYNTSKKKIKKEPRYVYMMIDQNTNYTKIGLSKDPKYRERTLQSQKPTIDLIFKAKGTWDDEKFLQDYFNEKRIRGEWFDLDESDMEYVKKYFQSAKSN
jgi:hypothetical protein